MLSFYSTAIYTLLLSSGKNDSELFFSFLTLFFQIQRGGPLDLQKQFLQCGGVICNHMQNLICRTSPNGPRNAVLSGISSTLTYRY